MENTSLGRNLSLMTELYELTMANGYFEGKKAEEIACFDLFFRKVPDNGGFAVFAGLSQIIEYVKNLNFKEEDLR